MKRVFRAQAEETSKAPEPEHCFCSLLHPATCLSLPVSGWQHEPPCSGEPTTIWNLSGLDHISTKASVLAGGARRLERQSHRLTSPLKYATASLTLSTTPPLRRRHPAPRLGPQPVPPPWPAASTEASDSWAGSFCPRSSPGRVSRPCGFGTVASMSRPAEGRRTPRYPACSRPPEKRR